MNIGGRLHRAGQTVELLHIAELLDRRDDSITTETRTASCRRLLEAELVEAGVEVAAADQLVVRAGVDDPAVVHDDDAVGQGDRRHAVRDHQRRAAADELLQHACG